ncbi:MAG: helix-turn-helix transcriptional regulator [Theionarchaea archaeon]|nr:MAG: hypothetical protein AYK19_15795 [Theionarchaea archaeon DG-70-1]MBU7026026.1 helix-turn-helix transcriptional regulator [Theionarchaea archaeon]
MEIEDLEVLKMLGSRGTTEILEFLSEHGEARYIQMQEFMNSHTLNTRMRELLGYGLVEHHIERTEKRREWYELTEKGKKVIKELKELIDLIKEPL